MVRQVKRAKSPRLGRQDRWPSDYGVRDAELNVTKRGAENQYGGWGLGAKREGREGRGKGERGSQAAAPSAQGSKKR